MISSIHSAGKSPESIVQIISSLVEEGCTVGEVAELLSVGDHVQGVDVAAELLLAAAQNGTEEILGFLIQKGTNVNQVI